MRGEESEIRLAMWDMLRAWAWPATSKRGEMILDPAAEEFGHVEMHSSP